MRGELLTCVSDQKTRFSGLVSAQPSQETRVLAPRNSKETHPAHPNKDPTREPNPEPNPEPDWNCNHVLHGRGAGCVKTTLRGGSQRTCLALTSLGVGMQGIQQLRHQLDSASNSIETHRPSCRDSEGKDAILNPNARPRHDTPLHSTPLHKRRETLKAALCNPELAVGETNPNPCKILKMRDAS